MRLRIHRGTKEIGGTCIEVEAQGKRIVLDAGLPLDAPDDEEMRRCLLPAVPGFRERDESLLGVLISHPHLDHCGLARHIRPDVPVWIGEEAHSILTAASRFVRCSASIWVSPREDVDFDAVGAADAGGDQSAGGSPPRTRQPLGVSG